MIIVDSELVSGPSSGASTPEPPSLDVAHGALAAGVYSTVTVQVYPEAAGYQLGEGALNCRSNVSAAEPATMKVLESYVGPV